MVVTNIEHSSHPQHLLELQRPSIPYICRLCKELGYDTCYECKRCNFYIHQRCAFPSSPQYDPLFKHCDFEFHSDPPHRRICDACTKDINGCSYQCTRCEHDLHPCCIKLPNELKSEAVTLKLSEKIPSKCLKCGTRKNSSEGAKGLAYASTCGNYCLHVACVKEMVYKAWEDGYFNQDQSGASMETSNSGLQIVLPITSTSVVQSSKGGKIAAKLRTMISVLTLIISAIFGDPFTACAAVILALARSLS